MGRTGQIGADEEWSMAAATAGSQSAQAQAARNEVVICGRLSAAAESRELPSGDTLVTLRVVIPRVGPASRTTKATGETRATQVDTIDVVCWTATMRRTALRLEAGATVHVEGALRRRFFGTPGGRQSRYEVEARSIRRMRWTTSTGT